MGCVPWINQKPSKDFSTFWKSLGCQLVNSGKCIFALICIHIYHIYMCVCVYILLLGIGAKCATSQ